MVLSLSSIAIADDARSETILFDIPQQPADLALTEFAEQADLTLVFPPELVREAPTNALVGRYTLEEGIQLLLAGTGLIPTLSDGVVLSIAIDEESNPEGEKMKGKKTGLFAALAAIFSVSPVVAQDTDAQNASEVSMRWWLPVPTLREKLTKPHLRQLLQLGRML